MNGKNSSFFTYFNGKCNKVFNCNICNNFLFENNWKKVGNSVIKGFLMTKVLWIERNISVMQKKKNKKFYNLSQSYLKNTSIYNGFLMNKIFWIEKITYPLRQKKKTKNEQNVVSYVWKKCIQKTLYVAVIIGLESLQACPKNPRDNSIT